MCFAGKFRVKTYKYWSVACEKDRIPKNKLRTDDDVSVGNYHFWCVDRTTNKIVDNTPPTVPPDERRIKEEPLFIPWCEEWQKEQRDYCINNLYNNVRDDYGFLNLYISGSTVENDTEEAMMSLNAAPIEIYHLVLIITSIKFKVHGEDRIIDLSESPLNIDLTDINNTRDLVDVFEVHEEQYSALHLYYDQEIIANTNQGNKTFDIQGSGFFNIPIQHSNANRTQTSIKIEKDMGYSLLLSFQMQIRWQQMLIIPNIGAFKHF